MMLALNLDLIANLPTPLCHSLSLAHAFEPREPRLPRNPP